jgi:ABC-2 type transport system ATP-binding protein
LSRKEGYDDGGGERTVIKASSLKKSYGQITAVDCVDLEVAKGTVFSLLGPNGAGKTTTVEILEGLRQRDGGEVKVLGLDPWTDGYELHKRIGVIPQGFKFFTKQTPREAVKYYSDLFGIKQPNIQSLLKLVVLEDASDVIFENLSGGQKQKMGLALALVNDPEVLFLDEPTTGLDPQARRAIWEVIERLKNEKRTVLLTTHYLEEAEALSDRVAIMNRGKIVAEGTPQELIERYGARRELCIVAGKEVADYLEEHTDLEVEWNARLSQILIQIKKKGDVLKAISALEESGLSWSDLKTQKESLEDIFVKLVGSKISYEGEG